MIGKDDRKEYTILKYLLLVFFSRKRDALIDKIGCPLNGKATDSFLQASQQQTARKALHLVSGPEKAFDVWWNASLAAIVSST